MPPTRTQDDRSCQHLYLVRPSPYIIPGHLPAASAQTAGLDIVPTIAPKAYQPNIPESSPISGIDPLPHTVTAEDMKLEAIDQTTAQISNPEVDDDHQESRDDGHPGDTTQSDSGPEDEYMVVLIRGSERDSLKKLEVFFIPEREPLQSQMNTLLDEGYRAAAGSQPSDLQLVSIEVRRLDSSGNPIARQFIESLGNGNPARSPTSSLTSIAASAEDTDSDSDSADLLSADQMIMDLLEEDSLSESPSSSSTIGSTSTRNHEAPDQVMELDAEEELDGLDRDGFLILSSTTGPSHVHSASAPSLSRLRSTPPLVGVSTVTELVGSAPSSTSYQGYPETPHNRSSTSTHEAPDSKPRRDACSSRSARPESPPPRSPSSPTAINGQTALLIPPSLGLALRPRHVVRLSQAGPSDSSEPPPRFDDLPLWIDHFNTLSTLASGLKLRDPLPGDKVSQNQAFLSFRNLFIELFSFSTKGSMIGVPASVSHFVSASRLGIVADAQAHRVLKLILEVSPYYKGGNFATLLLMLTNHLYDKNMARLRRYRRTYFRKADTVATLTLAEEIESVLVQLYPPRKKSSRRHVHPVKMRLEALRELMES